MWSFAGNHVSHVRFVVEWERSRCDFLLPGQVQQREEEREEGEAQSRPHSLKERFLSGKIIGNTCDGELWVLKCSLTSANAVWITQNLKSYCGFHERFVLLCVIFLSVKETLRARSFPFERSVMDGSVCVSHGNQKSLSTYFNIFLEITLLSLLTLTKHDCLFFFYSVEVRVTATDLVKLQNSRHTEKYNIF